MRDLARELNARGHEAHVITSTPGERELDGVKVHRLDVPLMPGLDDDPLAQGAGVRSRSCSLREQYDIVHCHTALSPLAIGGAYLAKKLGIPSVMTEHSVLRGAGLKLLSACHKLLGLGRLAGRADRGEPLRRQRHARRLGAQGRLRPAERHQSARLGAAQPAARRREAAAARDDGDALHQAQEPARGRARIPKIAAPGCPSSMRPLFTLVGDGPERTRVEREVAAARRRRARRADRLPAAPRDPRDPGALVAVHPADVEGGALDRHARGAFVRAAGRWR